MLNSDVKKIVMEDHAIFLKNRENVMSIKEILQKPCEQRSESDIDKVVHLLKKEKYFMERKNLTPNDMREIASYLTLE